ncbi:hypothetical protein [Pseudomonas phage vB_Pa-PAC2]
MHPLLNSSNNIKLYLLFEEYQKKCSRNTTLFY